MKTYWLCFGLAPGTLSWVYILGHVSLPTSQHLVQAVLRGANVDMKQS